MDAIFLSDSLYNRQFGHGRYIGPYAISANLRAHGYSSLVFDYFRSHPNFFSAFEKMLTKDTVFVGLSSTFLSPVEEKNLTNANLASLENYFQGELHMANADALGAWLAQLTSVMKRKAPKAKLVLGGAKALNAFSYPDIYKAFDYICLGAGDESVLNMVQALKRNELPETFEEKGLKVLKGVKLKTEVGACPDAQFSAIDAVQLNESLPLEVSRGCTFNCKFCHYEKRTSLRKSTTLLRQELLRNYERFGTTNYHFTDDCFNDHPDKVRTLCNLFLELPFKISWVSYARVDVAVKFPETINLMVDSGASALFWGIESLDETAARRAGKGTPPDKVKAFLKNFVVDHGDRCLTAASFIVGLPGESKESLNRTRDFICENKVMDVLFVSPLMIASYSERLDMKVIDYSDYARNPAKYGFTKVSFFPLYWEHEHMNSLEAHSLTEQVYKDWRTAHKLGGVTGIWHYPHLRTLGYSHGEIANLIRAEKIPEGFDVDSRMRFKNFLDRYFNSLESIAATYPTDVKVNSSV